MGSKLLIPAVRQYMHNDGEGLVVAYDLDETDEVVDGLVNLLSTLYPVIRSEWKAGDLDYSTWKKYNKSIGIKV